MFLSFSLSFLPFLPPHHLQLPASKEKDFDLLMQILGVMPTGRYVKKRCLTACPAHV